MHVPRVSARIDPARPRVGNLPAMPEKRSDDERADAAEGEGEGHPIDVRFSYANERTFLAWNRTALALIATGVAATQLLPKFDVTFGRRLLGLPLIALGALIALTSYAHWQANERAMRERKALVRSPIPLILSIGVGVVAVIAVVLAMFEGA
jgi:putative membrane protein